MLLLWSDGVANDGEAGDASNSGFDVENVTGAGGNDTIVGDGDHNTLTGNGGNDTITGGLGNDYLYGNAGSDTFYADDNLADYVDGGTGADAADVDPVIDIRVSIE